MNSIDAILEKALERVPLTREEAYELYDNAPLQQLCGVADTLRRSAVQIIITQLVLLEQKLKQLN